MAVGIMRAAFDAALEYTKTHDAGGSVVLLERQSVADLLIDVKMRVEAGRALVWKAAYAVERGEGGEELAYAAKIWCSEAAVKSVADAMRAVGVYVMFFVFVNLFCYFCVGFLNGMNAG